MEITSQKLRAVSEASRTALKMHDLVSSPRVCLETISAKSKLKQYKWFVEKRALVYHIASQSADNSSIN